MIDEKIAPALIELADTELYEVAGGGNVNIDGGSLFSFTISNADSNQGVQLSGIFGTVNFDF
jgi:hypothetical protein